MAWLEDAIHSEEGAAHIDEERATGCTGGTVLENQKARPGDEEGTTHLKEGTIHLKEGTIYLGAGTTHLKEGATQGKKGGRKARPILKR